MVGVALQGQVFGDQLQVSGTMTEGTALASIDGDTKQAVLAADPAVVDVNAIARDTSIAASTFDQIDMHGDLSGSTCTFWGVIIPSS